ncbi:MAG: cytidine/deoxycytidylate deaminase family protein [Nanoarchaeota archaeon]
MDKKQPDERLSWDDYFMNIAHAVAARSTCDRGKVGCVLVKGKRILSTGYAGSPVGLPHCDEAGHLMKTVYDKEGNASQHCVRTTHAEMNAIVQAARFGIAIDGATIYCKMEPCLDCCKAIINAGIKHVVCEKKYHAAETTRLFFKDAGVELAVLNDEVEKYEKQ